MLRTWDNLQIIRTKDLSPVAEIDTTVFGAVIFYDQNSRVILSSPYDDTKVYSTKSGKELFTFPQKEIRDIAISDSSKTLAAIYPTTVYGLWIPKALKSVSSSMILT